MASLDDVARIALALPGAHEGERFGNRTWFVGKKAFAWERPFTKADIKRFADATPPEGPILGVRVSSLDEKDVVLMSHRRGLFTIPHFDGFAAVLIQLNRATKRDLRQAINDAWSAMAPPKVAAEFWRARRDS
jgi:hypothetical protein